MKHYDTAQVWERVQSSPAPDPQSLQLLMDTLWLNARVFQQLAGKLPSPQAAVARELSQSNRQQLACLKGMHVLISGSAPAVRSIPVPGDPPDLLLRNCYTQALRLRTDYEARRSDPAYGNIFRTLAQQAQIHCHKILEILGAISK